MSGSRGAPRPGAPRKAAKAQPRGAAPAISLGDFVLGKLAGVSPRSARFEAGGLAAIGQVLAQACAAGDATADAAVNEMLEVVGFLAKKGMPGAARQLAKATKAVVDATTRELAGRLEDRRAQAARFAQFLSGGERPTAGAAKEPRTVKASSLVRSRRG